MAEANVFRQTDIENLQWQAPIAGAGWYQLEVGTQAELSVFRLALEANFKGFHENAGSISGADGYKIHTHVDSYSKTALFISESNIKTHVTVYELIPRHDIYGVSATISPLQMLNYEEQGDIVDTTAYGGTTAGSMTYVDPRFTPFRVPTLTSQYKITNIKNFTVGAGSRFTLNLACNNVDLNYLTDNPPATNISSVQYLYGKKNKYKCLLVKIYGELGVVSNGGEPPVKQIRNQATSLVGQVWHRRRGRAGADPRLIYQDETLAKNAIGDNTIGFFIDEENPALGTVGTVLNQATTNS